MSTYSLEHKEYLYRIRREKIIVTIFRIFIILLFLILWQLAADFGLINTFLFSSPKNVFNTCIKLFNDGSLFAHTWITLYEVLISFFISMILGLLIVGPIMHTCEQYILSGCAAFISLPFGIGAAIIGAFHQVIVVSGIHHVFNALEVELLSSTGLNPFNAIITGAIVAQGAAALAVALKTKDAKKRSLYISSAIPAFLGITEAAIFGVNLRFIKPFIFACVGGAAAGLFSGIINLAGTGMGVTALPGLLLYLNTNIVGYIIAMAIAIAVAFILTYVFFKTEE